MTAKTDRRQPGGPRPVWRLALLLLAVVLVAGCDGLVEDIAGGGNGGGGGGTRAPADLTTTKAERAAWPDAPKDAVAAEVQRVSDGDTFVATVKGRRERIRVIDARIADRLFEPLTTSKQEGLGLGLPICASIVEAHGGRIWLAAREAGTTEFRLSLPLEPAKE